MPRYSPRTGLLNTYQVGPFDTGHWYLQWSGKLPGGESWSCGLRLPPKDTTIHTVTQAHVDAAAAAVTAYHTSAGVAINEACKLSMVKLNNVGTNGKQPESGSLQHAVADVAGFATGAPPPNQVALVVSLTTGFSRGLGHSGRFYLPLPMYAVYGDGRINEASADAASDVTDTFIAALNELSPFHEVGVMSRKAGAPMHRKVTGNRVGRVYDTQRRRRRSLAEDYQ